MKSWFVRCLLSTVLLAGICLPAAAAPTDQACIWTGAVNNDYSEPLNWSCQTPPGIVHDVYIGSAPRSPRLNRPGSAKTLTLNPGGMLTLDPNVQLTIASGLTHNQGAELYPGPNSTVTLLNGDWVNNGGAVVGSGPWTAVFGGQGNQAITGVKPQKTFHKLTLNNASMALPEVGFGGGTTSVIVNGALTLNQDTALNTGVSGTLILNGDLINNGGGFRGSGVVKFEGSSDQVIGGSTAVPVFPGLVAVNKAAGTTLSLANDLAGVDFAGPLVIQGGALRLGGKSLTTNSATMVGPGTLDISGSGTWTASGPITLGSGGIFTPGSSTVKLNNTTWTNNGGSVVDTMAPWNLDISGPSAVINGTGATQSFFNVTVSPPIAGASSVEVGGSTTTMNVAGNLTFGPNTTFNAGTLGKLSIGANLLNNGGSFLGSRQLNTRFNGAGPQAIGGTVGSLTFPGALTVDKSNGEVTLSGNTQQVTINGGFFVYGGSFSLGPGTLTTAGPVDVVKAGTLNLGSGVWNAQSSIYFESGGTFNAGLGTLNFRGSYIAFYGGTVNPGASTTNFQMTGSQRISGKGTATFHNVNIHNLTMAPLGFTVGSTSSGPSALTATGDFYIGDDVIFNPGTATEIIIGGNFVNDGAFVSGASTVTFNGSAPLRTLDAVQNIGGGQRTTFNNLTVDNPAGVLLGASQEVSGVLNLRLGGLNAAGYTLALGSAATVSGTHSVMGAVQRTQAFTVGAPYSFGGANETITFTEIGSVTGLTVNTQSVAPAGLRPAIPRTVTITPVGANYNATLRLPYQDAELNGIGEADLRLWRRGAARWETGGPQVVNAAENWVEQSGITAFSTWALASINAAQSWRIYLPFVLK